MKYTPQWLTVLAAGAQVMGCGASPVGTESACEDALVAGDLVVTEVFANPDGTDGDGVEWIELFNAGSAPVQLSGAQLVVSKTDGTSENRHRFSDLSVPAGAYLVVTDAPADALPSYVDYSYGSSLSSLRNTEGLVALRCGDTVIDQMTYQSSSDGRSYQLSGSISPNHLQNDDDASWCNATGDDVEFDPSNFGTPGDPNIACAGTPTGSTCLDDGIARDIVRPAAGQLEITEWMANPAAVSDTAGEWFEIRANASVDLNGLVLGDSSTTTTTINDVNCLSVTAGSHVVFARNEDAAMNGGLTEIAGTFTFSLNNTDERITVSSDGILLDEVLFASSTAGAATQIDGSDVPCTATSPYGDGDLGTPGAANPSCGGGPIGDTCLDDGTPRAVVKPTAGQAKITEWMANPAAVDDTQGEWFEVRFSAAVDLNGLVLGDAASTTTVTSADCIRVSSGEHVVFARNDDSGTNGGVTGVLAEFSFSLNNTNETISVSSGSTVLDTVTYATSVAGTATQIDATEATCSATTTYGAGDKGTPGTINPLCI